MRKWIKYKSISAIAYDKNLFYESIRLIYA